MNIRTKENNKYITMYIPSFEVFYKVIKRITFEIKNNDFESFKRYNFESDLVKQRFEKYYYEHENETVSLRNIKYNCNAKCFNTLSKDFYMERGWDEKHAIAEISRTQHERSLKSAEKMTDDRIPNQINYWIKKGYSLEAAKKEVHNRQITFSKDLCLKKYGDKKGLIIFEERQKKWQKTIHEKFSIDEIANWKRSFNFASKEACDLFEPFFQKLKDTYKCYMFLENNPVKEYFIVDRELSRYYFYDFTITDLKLIFEFNGNHVHPNPKLSKDDWIKWRHAFSKKTADEIYEIDKRKIEIAEQNGFKVVLLWNDMNKEDLKNIISSEIRARELFLQQQCPQHE